jgi:endonuclease/exonuclease/phosphatase family metal-dependent hydrolase
MPNPILSNGLQSSREWSYPFVFDRLSPTCRKVVRDGPPAHGPALTRAFLRGDAPGLKTQWRNVATRIRITSPLGAAVAAALLCAAPARADDGMVRIMTQNVYEGTNFTELTAATTPAEFVAAITTTYQNILATKPAERAAAIAGEIARERPDIVALQEAATVLTGTPATTVQSDYLQSLMGDLDGLGQNYAIVAKVPEQDAEAPSTLGFDVRLAVEDAILVNLGDNARLSNIQVHGYSTNLINQTAVGPIPSPRGWASVDVSLRGDTFRFATTHLEISQPVQLAQMNELISSVGGTTLPLIMAGDFNANADDPTDPTFATYKDAIDAGFVDAWSAAHGNDPGYTCCQAEDLLNTPSSLNQRIDLVLLRGGIGVDDIQLIGDNAGDRTPSGLWPSDHAGVFATLEIPEGNVAIPEPSTWLMAFVGFATLGLAGWRVRRVPASSPSRRA